MDNIKKFEDFLDRMQGLLDNAKEQGHIIVRVEDFENAFPELKEEESKEKPNGGIVMENFDEGDGFYKVNLAYLNKKQVEEIEELARKWNQEVESADERIRKEIISALKYANHKGVYDKHIVWLEKQGEQKPEENKGNVGGISSNWSEEDSFRTETLISVIKSGGSIRPELRNEFVNWLKSLKERIGG